MLQTMSNVITLCKQNMGLRDLPKPVTDEELRQRIILSVLPEFSQIYPYKSNFIIGEKERVCRPVAGFQTNHTQAYSGLYQIPPHYYQDRHIVSVANVGIQRPNGYNDLYVPQGMIGDPASLLTGMASIQLVGAMARTMTHALTWDFRAPDLLVIYNGWSGGNYEIELDLTHDESLSTLPPGTFSVFTELCQLDLEEYLYAKLRRLQGMDLGTGSIELKIDDWADAKSRKRDYIKELAESAVLDDMHIMYW